MIWCPAVYTLTAYPIEWERVKHRLDCVGAINGNEKTMDGELESPMAAKVLACGSHGNESCNFPHFCVVMKQNCHPLTLSQAAPNSLEALIVITRLWELAEETGNGSAVLSVVTVELFSTGFNHTGSEPNEWITLLQFPCSLSFSVDQRDLNKVSLRMHCYYCCQWVNPSASCFVKGICLSASQFLLLSVLSKGT